MLCRSCGEENDREADYCIACRTPQPRARFSVPVNSAVTVIPQKKRIANTSKLILLSLGVFVSVIVAACVNNQPTPQRTQQASSPQQAHQTSAPAPTSSAGAAPPKTFPLLHIATSGRLPTSFHELKLGIAFSEAIKLDLRLQNFSGGAAFLNSNDEAMVQDRTSDGIFLLVTFTHGRAVEVEADLSDVSPEDAENVDSVTFGQLGAAESR